MYLELASVVHIAHIVWSQSKSRESEIDCCLAPLIVHQGRGARDQGPGFQWRLRKCVGLQTDLDNIGKVERVRALQESL